ncbi:PrgI family protein [bacterium]|nr:PrgI family protein [bacterium]
MRYIVPQFIDIESKIFGPITVRQFLIMTVGGLFIFLAFKLADFSLFIFETIIISIVIIVFAFVKINGKLFHNFLLDLLNYIFKTPKIAVWDKEVSILNIKKAEIEKEKDPYSFQEKKLPHNKLSELSLILDTGGAYVGENGKKDSNLKNI